MRKFILIFSLLANTLYPQWVSNYGIDVDGPRVLTHISGMDVTADVNGNCYVTGYTKNAIAGDDIILIKYGVNGKMRFMRTYNGNANGEDKAFGIAVDEDGFIYIVGQTEQIGSYIDLVLLKYDNSGNFIWNRTFSAENVAMEDKGVAVGLDDEGNVIVAGYCTGEEGHKDILIQKYSSDGNNLWTKRIDGEGTLSCQATDLAIGSQGTISVTGFASYTKNMEQIDIITCDLSAEGNINWTSIYNGTNFEDKAFGIAIDEDGQIYVAGYTTIEHDTSNTGAILIKYGEQGSQIWTRVLESDNSGSGDRAWGIAVDSDNNIYITGQYLFNPNLQLDYFLAKYESSGDISWFRTYNGPGNGKDVATDIVILRNGRLAVTGFSKGPNNFDYSTLLINWSNGNMHKELRYSLNASSNDYALGIAASKQNDVFVTGYSELVTGLNSDANSSISTLMYEGDADNIEPLNTPSKFSLYQNYPNPFNPSTTIKFDIPDNLNVKLVVYDMIGKVVDIIVDKELGAGSYSISYKNNNLSSGIYFYQLTAGNFTDVKKMSFIK